jgi:hypothetical protein
MREQEEDVDIPVLAFIEELYQVIKTAFVLNQ